MNRNILLAVVGVVLFVSGLGLGYYLQSDHTVLPASKEGRTKITETRSHGTYKFINPLLECDNATPLLRPSINMLEGELQRYSSESMKSGDITEIAIYYRDLNNGPWIGVGSDKPYSPASLLKVPIMMAALKKAESERGLLSKKFKFDASVPNDFVDPNIEDEVIRFGQSYTYQDLITRMIAYSDNNAKNLLVTVLGDEAVSQIWADLGMIGPNETTPDDFLSVKDYSSFFRILYNATYLNKEMSELGLEILSQSHFDKGLRKGLPDGVVLSNKFGERGLIDSNQKQLHDCGIVYASPSPYLLCVMTKGSDWEMQASVISEISTMVYRSHMASN